MPRTVSQRSVDEITPIITYIVGEMNRNAASQTAQRIRDLNTFDYEGCIREFTELPWWQQLFGLGVTPEQCFDQEMSSGPTAYALWGWMVRQDGDWDHKPYIQENFYPAVSKPPQHKHRYHGELFFYDIWSNIHYGYVGEACGFTESELLDGAGLEQIGSDLLRGQWPRGDSMSGLRRFDDPSDRAAISIGLQLYPQPATVDAVRDAVLADKNLTRWPYP